MDESKLQWKPEPLPKGSEYLPNLIPGYPRTNIVVFAIFLAFVLFRYVDGGNRVDLFAAIRLEFLLGGTAVALTVAKVTQNAIRVGNARKLVILIALLFVAMIVQLPFAMDPEKAQRVFVDRAYKFALLTFLIAGLVESPSTLRLFILAFLFATFYVTLEATEGWITGGLVWENQGVLRLHGAVPMYGHPNSLGGVAMGALPFIIYLFSPFRSRVIRAGLLALTVTAMVCVIFSGSRTAYVGLFAFASWWFFKSRRKVRSLIIACVVAILAIPVIPDQYIERFKSIGGEEAEGNSKETRIIILEDAMAIFLENPLGVGVASFPAARFARFGRIQDTHNLYLEVATNLGIQGLLIFLGMVWAMMASFRDSEKAFSRQLIKLRRIAREGGLSPPVQSHVRQHYRDLEFMIATAKATAGFVIVRLTLGLFGMDLYEIYWWFASGLAIALAALVLTTRRKTAFFEELCSAKEEEALV